jgi:Prokineticin
MIDGIVNVVCHDVLLLLLRSLLLLLLLLFFSSSLEWDHCRFHEDCGEGNCCYVHFRFRSLPKWFCRPNRKDQNELCEPLAKYRSLKDVPAWKQQQQQKIKYEDRLEQF